MLELKLIHVSKKGLLVLRAIMKAGTGARGTKLHTPSIMLFHSNHMYIQLPNGGHIPRRAVYVDVTSRKYRPL